MDDSDGCLNLVANVRCSSCRDANAMRSISSNSTFSELFGLRLICDVSIAKLWCVEVLFFRVDFFFQIVVSICACKCDVSLECVHANVLDLFICGV